MEKNKLTSSLVSKICLICCSTIQSPSVQSQGIRHHQPTKFLLAIQLNIIFILRNLLEVPVDKLQTYLKDFGNPDEWLIALCDKCSVLTNKAIKLNYQLAVITKKIRSRNQEVLDKIKNSLTEAGDEDDESKDANIIFREVRSLVKDNNNMVIDNGFNSFLEGDQKADNFFQKSKSSLMNDPLPDEAIKKEPENLWENEDNHTDNDKDWLPPTSYSPPATPSSPPQSTPKLKKSSQPKALRRSRAKSKIDPNRKIRSVPIDKFICTLCPDTQKATFRYASKWKDHLISAHDTETITCPETMCKGLSFDILDEFLAHRQKMHLFREPRKCEYCGKIYKCLKTYYSHRKLKHGHGVNGTQGNGKIWICDYCGKELSSRTGLKGHLKYQHKRDLDGKELTFSKHVCELCGLELKSKQGVKAHYRIVHKREHVATCHLCGQELKNKFNLKQHLIRKHKDEAREEVEGMKVGGKGNELWRCRVPGCPRYYFEKNKLEEHRRERHGIKGEEEGEGKLKERPFKCETCGQGFWMKHKLRDHEKIHEKKGKMDWKCEDCGKGFGFKKYLRDHIVRTHKISREELDKKERERSQVKV